MKIESIHREYKISLNQNELENLVFALSVLANKFLNEYNEPEAIMKVDGFYDDEVKLKAGRHMTLENRDKLLNLIED